MKLEVEIEQFEELMVDSLNESIATFEDDLERLKEGISCVGIFSTDKEEDKRQIKKMIKAMKRVRTWYGVGYDL